LRAIAKDFENKLRGTVSLFHKLNRKSLVNLILFFEIQDELKEKAAKGANAAAAGKKREAVYDKGGEQNKQTSAEYVPKVLLQFFG